MHELLAEDEFAAILVFRHEQRAMRIGPVQHRGVIHSGFRLRHRERLVSRRPELRDNLPIEILVGQQVHAASEAKG